MRLGFAFFASAAESGPDGKFSVLGGDFDAIELPRLPGRVPTIGLVAKIMFGPPEWGSAHLLRISFTSPSGRDIMPVVEGEIVPQPPANAVPDHECGASIVLDLNAVNFREEGVHVLHINCDDRDIGTLPLFVSARHVR